MNKWIEFGTLLSPLATLFAIITFFMGIITPLRKKLKQKNTKKVVKKPVHVQQLKSETTKHNQNSSNSQNNEIIHAEEAEFDENNENLSYEEDFDDEDEIIPPYTEELDEDDEIPFYDEEDEEEDYYTKKERKSKKIFIIMTVLIILALAMEIIVIFLSDSIKYQVVNSVKYWIIIIFSFLSAILCITEIIYCLGRYFEFRSSVKEKYNSSNVFLWSEILSTLFSIVLYLVIHFVLIRINKFTIFGSVLKFSLILTLGFIVAFAISSLFIAFLLRNKTDKNSMKKILITCLYFVVANLALSPLGTTIAINISPAYVKYENHYFLKTEDKTLSFIMSDYDDTILNIPSQVNGRKVTSISFDDGSLEGNKNYKEIIFPDTIETLPHRTLTGCSNLEKLTLPRIDWQCKYSFTNTDNIFEGNIVLGYLFGMTEFQNSYSVSAEISGKAISGTDEGKTVYGTYKYYLPKSLYSVTINGGTIGPNTFNNCTNVTEVNLNVTSVAKNSFDGCGALKTINNVTYIDKWAYKNVSGAQDITLKADTIGVAESAFSSSTINNVILNDGLRYIGKLSITAKMETLKIPASVVKIDAHAFTINETKKVIFGSCDNWQAGDTPLPPKSLANPETAATYLKTIYANVQWIKTESA